VAPEVQAADVQRFKDALWLVESCGEALCPVREPIHKALFVARPAQKGANGEIKRGADPSERRILVIISIIREKIRDSKTLQGKLGSRLHCKTGFEGVVPHE